MSAPTEAPLADPGPAGSNQEALGAITRTLWVGSVLVAVHLLGAFDAFDRTLADWGTDLRSDPSRDRMPLLLAADARAVDTWGPPPWSPSTWSRIAEGLATAGIHEAFLVDPYSRLVDARGVAGTPVSGITLWVPHILDPSSDPKLLPTEYRIPKGLSPFADHPSQLYLPPHGDGVLRALGRTARAGELYGDSTFCLWNGRCPSGGEFGLTLHRPPDLPTLSLADLMSGTVLAPEDADRTVLIGLTANPYAEQIRIGDGGTEVSWPVAVASVVSMARARAPAVSLGALGDAALILGVLVLAGLFEATERRLRAELRLLGLPLVAAGQATLWTWVGAVHLPIGAIAMAAAAPPFLTALAGRRVALAVLRKAALLVAQDAWDSGWRSAQIRSHTELAYKLAALARNQTRSHRTALLVRRPGGRIEVLVPYGIAWESDPPSLPDALVRSALRGARGADATPLVAQGHRARLFAVRTGRGVAGFWLVAWAPDEVEPDIALLGRLVARLGRSVELTEEHRSVALHERLLDHVAAETASVRDLLVLASEERRRQVMTLHAIEMPVLTADLTGQALFVNRALSAMLEETELGPVRSIRELVFRLRGESGLDDVMRALFLGHEPIRIPWLDPLQRLWMVVITPVIAQETGDDRAILGYAAFFQDRTDTVRLDDLRESVVEFSSARVRDALTVIIGYAGLARERIEDSTTRVMMDTVHERAVQVSKALEDLKAVGQLAAAEHLTITVDARRLLQSVLEEVEPIADERDVAFRSFIPEIGLPIRVVPDDARDALAALLREAAVTAPSGSEIVLRLDQDHQTSSILVMWQGPGLDPLVREHCVGAWHERPERLPEALRPFARVRRSFPFLDLRSTPGGGLTVSLAMHHGAAVASA